MQLAAHNVLLSPPLFERRQYSMAEISARSTFQLGVLRTIADNDDPPLEQLNGIAEYMSGDALGVLQTNTPREIARIKEPRPNEEIFDVTENE
jgi:hypothetical protein